MPDSDELWLRPSWKDFLRFNGAFIRYAYLPPAAVLLVFVVIGYVNSTLDQVAILGLIAALVLVPIVCFVLGLLFYLRDRRRAWLAGPEGVAIHDRGKRVRFHRWSEISKLEEREFGMVIVSNSASGQRVTEMLRWVAPAQRKDFWDRQMNWPKLGGQSDSTDYDESKPLRRLRRKFIIGCLVCAVLLVGVAIAVRLMDTVPDKYRIEPSWSFLLILLAGVFASEIYLPGMIVNSGIKAIREGTAWDESKVPEGWIQSVGKPVSVWKAETKEVAVRLIGTMVGVPSTVFVIAIGGALWVLSGSWISLCICILLILLLLGKALN